MGERSHFRKGVMMLDADGFTLSGIGVTPLRWLGRMGCAGYGVCGLVLFLAKATTIPDAVVFWIGGVAFCMGLIGGLLERVLTEARRTPQEIRVCWDDVLEAQFDSGMRWIVVFYRTPEPKLGGAGPLAQLPLNNITPAIAAAFWDALDAYAPGRTREIDHHFRWSFS